jgi:hypothetical protein
VTPTAPEGTVGKPMMRKVKGTMRGRMRHRPTVKQRLRRRFTFRSPAARFEKFFNSLLITQLMGVRIKKLPAKIGSRRWQREQRRDSKGRFA